MCEKTDILQTLHAAMEGLSHRKIALHAGVRAATISDIVNGKIDPRLSTIEKIIEACKELKGETG